MTLLYPLLYPLLYIVSIIWYDISQTFRIIYANFLAEINTNVIPQIDKSPKDHPSLRDSSDNLQV